MKKYIKSSDIENTRYEGNETAEKVGLVNGFAKVDIGDGRELVCFQVGGLYNLKLKDYNVHTGFASAYLAEDKSRLSTINKYARRYGVEFVDEVTTYEKVY